MSDKKAKKTGARSTVLDVITGKIGKITGLITVVVALLTGVAQMLGGAQKISEMWAPGRRLPGPDCFDVKMDVRPTTVPVRKWDTVRFDLTGWNKCKQTLAVHVAFKATSDAVRIEPPFRSPDQAACRGDENPACWEIRTLDRAKEVKWTLTPPRLTQLGPLADPITVDINWTVYDTETKKRLRAGTSGLTVRGDASP